MVEQERARGSIGAREKEVRSCVTISKCSNVPGQSYNVCLAVWYSFYNLILPY